MVATTVQPRQGVQLTSRSVYLNNLLFANEDPYGRKTYHAYRVSDSAKIRIVQGTVPSFSLANFTAVLNHSRPVDPDPNGASLVTDVILDAEGQQVELVDPRGVSQTANYDSRGRAVEQIEAAGTTIAAKTVTIYDAQGNVLETRSPRYFDSGAGGCDDGVARRRIARDRTGGRLCSAALGADGGRAVGGVGPRLAAASRPMIAANLRNV